MATLSSANTKYTAEQLTKATGISAETLATWGLTEATDTLTMSQLAEMASSDVQAKKVLEKIVAQNAQAVANGEVTASNVALTASEGGATLATGAFTTAIKANISAMWTWMTTTPLGWLTLLATGVFAAVKAYDALTVSVEEQKEKMEESLSAYEDAKSELSNITTELESQEQAMNELLAKEKLTYAEKGQLEELQAITQELLIQKDLAEKEEGRTKKEVATDTSDLFKKQFGKYDISESAINEYQNNADITGNNAILISDENDISAMIAGYRQFNELLDEAYGEGNQENIDHFKSLTDDLKDSIFTTAQDLQEQQSNISDYYNTIKDVPYEELTSDQKEIVDSYNAISNAIALIYKQLDPNTWNTMQIDNLFATDGIEKTKEELIEMAKAGTLDETTIKSYSKLNSTLENSNMVLNNGQSAASALCNELYALADAEGSVEESVPDETDILSFSDAWNSEDFENARKELLSLAEAGQLTPETLQSTEEYKTLLEQTGLSAEEAAKKINSMTDASTQLQSMSEQISKMSDMLADKKNGTVASASDLAGFDATVKGLESWEEFERVMGSSKSSMEECQAAANALATEWVNNGNFLANLTEENKQYYVTQLDNMGVENADAVVTEVLGEKKVALSLKEQALAITKGEVTSKSADEVNALLNEANASDTTREYLFQLVSAEQAFNNTSLDVGGKVAKLGELASAYGQTAIAAKIAASNAGNEAGHTQGSWSAADLKHFQDEITASINTPIKIKPTGSSGYTAPKSKSGSGSNSNSKQTIDWIERKLDVLQKKIDATKAKFENLFTLKDKKNNLNEQIKLTNSLLNTTNKAAERYKKAANGVKLSDSLKKKVQNGAYDITEYGDKTAQNIQKYQNYIDKYNELIKQADTLNTDIRNLKSERYQLYIDDADARTNRYETLMDGTTSTGKRISYLKKSKKTISTSYKNKIKQAINDGNYVEASTLRAEWKNALKDNTISQYQERADKADKKAAKSQALAALDEGNYKKQNKHLESQKKSLRESYNWQIKIAKKKGDTLEVARLQAEKEKELRDLTKEEFDNIVNTYDNQVGLNNNKIKAFQDQISLLEAKGQQVGSALLNKPRTPVTLVMG